MVKRIVGLGVVVVALMAAGIVHFQKDGDEVNITIDRARLRQVSGKLLDESEVWLDDAQQALKERRERNATLPAPVEDGFRQVQSGFDRLESGYDSLQSGYDRFNSEYERVQSGYNRIGEEYNRIQDGLRGAQAEAQRYQTELNNQSRRFTPSRDRR